MTTCNFRYKTQKWNIITRYEWEKKRGGGIQQLAVRFILVTGRSMHLHSIATANDNVTIPLLYVSRHPTAPLHTCTYIV